MTNNENKLYDLLKADDIIPHILSQIPNIDERNALSEFLRKTGALGHKEMELTFAFYYMTSESFKAFTKNQIQFLDELSLKSDDMSDRVSSLTGILDEKLQSFDDGVKESMFKGIDNIVTHIKALSSYVIELSEKQALTKDDVNNKLKELISEQIEPVFKLFNDVHNAKITELEPEIDKLVLACLSKRLQKGESSKVMELSKKIDTLVSKMNNAASFSTAQLVGLMFGSSLVGFIITSLMLKLFH